VAKFSNWKRSSANHFQQFSFLVLCCACICLAMVSVTAAVCDLVGVSNHRPSDAELLVFVAGKLLFWQEAKEKILFLLFTCSAGLCVLFSPVAMRRFVLLPPRINVLAKLSPSLIAFSAIAILLAARDFTFAPNVVDSSSFGIIGALWQPVVPVQYCAVFLCTIAIWLLYEKASHVNKQLVFEKGFLVFGCVVAALIAYRLSWIQGPSVLGWSPQIVHESVLVQPVFEVLRGGYVFSSVTSQYGGFAQVAAALGHFSSDSRAALSNLMVVVAFIEFVAILLTLRIVGANSFLALIGMLAVVWFTPVVFTDYSLFQCAQIRWLFPILLMLIAACVHIGKSRLATLAWVLLPLAVFWNPETGIVSILAWSSFTAWRTIKKRSSPRLIGLGVLWALASSACILALYFMGSGTYPNIATALKYIDIFAQAGFGMLPMSAIHWWNIYAIAALAALLFAWNSPFHPASGLTWIAGTFCFLLFPYFLGRSYVTNLFWIFFPIVMMWAVAVATSSRMIGCWRIVLAIPLLAAASAVVTTPFRWPALPDATSRSNAKAERQAIQTFVTNAALDKSLASVAFVSPQAYALEELVSAPNRKLPPALAATLLVEQARQWERYALEANEIFVDDSFFGSGASLDHPWPQQFLARLLQRYRWESEIRGGENRLWHGVRADVTSLYDEVGR
jgi:hypothetical protein